MAIDGVAPRAKMNQQRSRRFQTSKDNKIREAEEERLRKQFEMEGKQVLPKQESEVSDSNVITPGTEFMHELSKALKSYISSRISGDSLWNYVMDADLIMLAMATHEPHFSVLREDVPIQQLQQQKIVAKPFKFLHIWLLREYLEIDMKVEDPPKNFSFELDRIIDDFIFMCFFAGNDFLPHMPTLEIHEGAIDLLMTVYKKEFNNLGGYLVDMSRIGEKNAAFIKLSRVEKFILKVGTYEEKIFKKRSDIRDRQLRRLINDYEDAKQEEKNVTCHSVLDNESTSDCALLICKAPASKEVSVPATSAEIFQNTKDLRDELRKCMREKCNLFKSGEYLIDKIKLGAASYKERYYKVRFFVEGPTDIECKRKEIVQKYTEGLLWVLQYYFSDVASWTWFYPFHYGPFASDLKGMGQVRVKFEKGVPFLPLDQLLSVLPPQSAHALPKAYAQLMLDEHSRILDFYPQDFEVDLEAKRFLWQGICKLPWIEESRLLAETVDLKNQLSANEAIRNSVKLDCLFVRRSNKLVEKICSLCLGENSSYKLNMRICDGIGGIISLCHEGVDKPCLGMEICDNEKTNCVLYVYYEVPAGNHIPRLLSGVNLPEKTIFGGDIMETELWHERQNHSRFERVQNQVRWRSEHTERSTSKFSPNATTHHTRNFSSNMPPEVMHKGATGVGWSVGRGKACNSSNVRGIDAMSSQRMPSLSPFHKQHKDAGSYHVTTTRDIRSQHFVDNFRQLRISESNHLPRPGDRSQFQPYNNGYTNQSTNPPYHQGSQSEIRLQNGSSRVNSWKSASTNSSLRPQWNGAKSYQVKDQNRW
ncbi:5'-3' exoribonuclease 3-like [Abrus precatorius]|uniref:5'-3' exoribonuclease n=1 Tax=Abrus precatorius TaxID=3816 RepID=A0A8B8KS90_ABRPR|nr:5'-3' exoribonuclease 3-like [Abrus precatorius]